MNDIINVEVWKPILGFEGLYEISNFGRVKSLERTESYEWQGKLVTRRRRGRIMALSPDEDGYQLVSLGKDGKRPTKKVHRLVAQAFVPNPDNLPFINHKDRKVDNNYVDNLEWCTPKYNIHYKGARKQAALAQSKAVIGRHIETGKIIEYPSVSSAMRDGYTHVSDVIHGRRNYDKGYTWEFK